MGCDIHFFVEKFDGKAWVCQDRMKTVTEDGYTYTTYESYSQLFYTGRNYSLFAILADVRNGVGFAGVDTGDRLNPISEPRGLPHNVSKVLAEHLGEDGDLHSHSWFTLRELLDYDWCQSTKHRGWVDMKTFVEWQRFKEYAEHPSPDSYSGGVAGPTIKRISIGEARTIFLNAKDKYHDKLVEYLEPYKDTYVQAQWNETYWQSAGTFFSRTIPRLLNLAGGVKGVDDVRVVFAFDN